MGRGEIPLPSAGQVAEVDGHYRADVQYTGEAGRNVHLRGPRRQPGPDLLCALPPFPQRRGGRWGGDSWGGGARWQLEGAVLPERLPSCLEGVKTAVNM